LIDAVSNEPVIMMAFLPEMSTGNGAIPCSTHQSGRPVRRRQEADFRSVRVGRAPWTSSANCLKSCHLLLSTPETRARLKHRLEGEQRSPRHIRGSPEVDQVKEKTAGSWTPSVSWRRRGLGRVGGLSGTSGAEGYSCETQPALHPDLYPWVLLSSSRLWSVRYPVCT
jgi:hypothetical protein